MLPAKPTHPFPTDGSKAVIPEGGITGTFQRLKYGSGGMFVQSDKFVEPMQASLAI